MHHRPRRSDLFYKNTFAIAPDPNDASGVSSCIDHFGPRDAAQGQVP
jgi:hypothetical protein